MYVCIWNLSRWKRRSRISLTVRRLRVLKKHALLWLDTDVSVYQYTPHHIVLYKFSTGAFDHSIIENMVENDGPNSHWNMYTEFIFMSGGVNQFTLVRSIKCGKTVCNVIKWLNCTLTNRSKQHIFLSYSRLYLILVDILPPISTYWRRNMCNLYLEINK